MKANNIIPEDDGSRRLIWLSFGAFVMFFLLLSRLWYLQVIDTDNLLDQSESNRLRFVPVAAPRGAILDRNGKVLVSNTPSFSVAVIPKSRISAAPLSPYCRFTAAPPVTGSPDYVVPRWS